MFTRAITILAAVCLMFSLYGCKLAGQLPYYRESNQRRPADEKPYKVHREQPYPKRLIDPALREQGTISRSMDFVIGVARPWQPQDVAKKNRSKLEKGLGRPVREGEDKTHPLHADPFPDVDVILAISGGGHRAANLGSAVLLELSRYELTSPNGRRVNLLETLDTISTVSGGRLRGGILHLPPFLPHREC